MRGWLLPATVFCLMGVSHPLTKTYLPNGRARNSPLSPLEETYKRIFQFLYSHEDVCGDHFADVRWIPAASECRIPCEITSNLCMLNGVSKHDQQQLCKPLPPQCADGLRNVLGSSNIMPISWEQYRNAKASETAKARAKKVPPPPPKKKAGRPPAKTTHEPDLFRNVDEFQRDTLSANAAVRPARPQLPAGMKKFFEEAEGPPPDPPFFPPEQGTIHPPALPVFSQTSPPPDTSPMAQIRSALEPFPPSGPSFNQFPQPVDFPPPLPPPPPPPPPPNPPIFQRPPYPVRTAYPSPNSFYGNYAPQESFEGPSAYAGSVGGFYPEQYPPQYPGTITFPTGPFAAVSAATTYSPREKYEASPNAYFNGYVKNSAAIKTFPAPSETDKFEPSESEFLSGRTYLKPPTYYPAPKSYPTDLIYSKTAASFYQPPISNAKPMDTFSTSESPNQSPPDVTDPMPSMNYHKAREDPRQSRNDLQSPDIATSTVSNPPSSASKQAKQPPNGFGPSTAVTPDTREFFELQPHKSFKETMRIIKPQDIFFEMNATAHAPMNRTTEYIVTLDRRGKVISDGLIPIKPLLELPAETTDELDSIHFMIDDEDERLGLRRDHHPSCCRWAVAGMCDGSWKKARSACGKSCGTLVCEEQFGVRACSRILDVDINECFNGVPRLIGLRSANNEAERRQLIEAVKTSSFRKARGTTRRLHRYQRRAMLRQKGAQPFGLVKRRASHRVSRERKFADPPHVFRQTLQSPFVPYISIRRSEGRTASRKASSRRRRRP